MENAMKMKRGKRECETRCYSSEPNPSFTSSSSSTLTLTESIHPHMSTGDCASMSERMAVKVEITECFGCGVDGGIRLASLEATFLDSTFAADLTDSAIVRRFGRRRSLVHRIGVVTKGGRSGWRGRSYDEIKARRWNSRGCR